MKTKLLTLAVLATAFMATSAQAAGDWRSNLYIKMGAGWNHANDQSFPPTETEFEQGYGVSGALGYDFGPVRGELEIAYRQNDIENIYVGGAPQNASGGDISSTAFMVNAYYDIPMGGAITPYIGAGIGMANVSVNDFHYGVASVGDTDDDVFAYQGIVGANYLIDGGFSLFTEYKYFATDDVDISAGNSGEYTNHSILAGFKYDFN